MAGFFFSFNREKENQCHEMLKEHGKKLMKTFHSDLFLCHTGGIACPYLSSCTNSLQTCLISSRNILYSIFEKLTKPNYCSSSIYHPNPRLFLGSFLLASTIKKILYEPCMTENIITLACDGTQYDKCMSIPERI